MKLFRENWIGSKEIYYNYRQFLYISFIFLNTSYKIILNIISHTDKINFKDRSSSFSIRSIRSNR